MRISKRAMQSRINKTVNSTLSDFKESFTIEKASKASDGQGGFTKSWSIYSVIDSGLVFVMDNSKMILDDHIKSKEIKRFEFSYVEGLTTEMRIVYKGYVYNIMPPQSVADSNMWSKIVAWKDFAT